MINKMVFDIDNMNRKQVLLRIVALVLIGIIVQLGATYVMNGVFVANGVSEETYDSYERVYEILSSQTPGMIVYVSFVAPMIEELIFRLGLLGLGSKLLNDIMWRKSTYNNRRKIYLWCINVIQALAFGIYHGNIVQGTYAFLIGVFIGYVFMSLGGYVSAFIVHSSINISGLFLVPFLPECPHALLSFVVGAGVLAIAIVGTVILRYWNIQKLVM